ncbi:MAG: right-handed parallel beta-helix repeat-containing protein [Promethearchaeota archaeon]
MKFSIPSLYEKKRIMIVILLLACITSFVGSSNNLDIKIQEAPVKNVQQISASWNVGNIVIDNWTYASDTHDWCYYENGQYIIENVTFDFLRIENTTDAFEIRYCVFNRIQEYESGIYLRNASNGIIYNNTMNGRWYGVYARYCSNITILRNVMKVIKYCMSLY